MARRKLPDEDHPGSKALRELIGPRYDVRMLLKNQHYTEKPIDRMVKDPALRKNLSRGRAQDKKGRWYDCDLVAPADLANYLTDRK